MSILSEKRCSRCGEIKPVSEFGKSKTKGGLKSWCNSCNNEYHHIRYANIGKPKYTACVDCGEPKTTKRAQESARCVSCSNKAVSAYRPMPDGMKRCTKCKELKPLDQFYKNPQNVTGLMGRCIACSKKYAEEYRARPETKEYFRQYGKVNAERRRARDKAFRENNPELYSLMRQRQKLLERYGISLDDYQAMLDAQNGVCAICGQQNQAGRSPLLHVDHDHETGKVRGLLCNNCNSALGFLQDSPDIVLKLYEYIVQAKGGMK